MNHSERPSGSTSIVCLSSCSEYDIMYLLKSHSSQSGLTWAKYFPSLSKRKEGPKEVAWVVGFCHCYAIVFEHVNMSLKAYVFLFVKQGWVNWLEDPRKCILYWIYRSPVSFLWKPTSGSLPVEEVEIACFQRNVCEPSSPVLLAENISTRMWQFFTLFTKH